MNIYVVPEIDIERFKETGVFAVQLLNNEAMAHDGIYLESDRAKEFAEFFKDNMAEYESVCKNALVKWYNSHNETKITLENVFVVWACKTLQNYKALLSTTVSGDGIYAEYTYNGDKQELYEDVYGKLTNQCIKTA